MKVKEMIELLDNTDFSIKADRHRGKKVVQNREDLTFKLSLFGRGSFGMRSEDTIQVFVYDNDTSFSNTVKYYSSVYNIDEEVMNMKLKKIRKIELDGYINESSSGKGYDSNHSKLVIEAIKVD